MIRFLLKKRLKKHFTNLLVMYKQIELRYKRIPQLTDVTRVYQTIFYNSLPNRQHFFYFNFLNESKIQIWSTGKLLLKMGYTTKFYKRNATNIAILNLQLKKMFYSKLFFLYIYYIKNFTYRQLLFYKKFMLTVNASIYYFLIKQMFRIRLSPVKRIKRRILRFLSKQ